jgi:hypothetical protein
VKVLRDEKELREEMEYLLRGGVVGREGVMER